MGSITTGSFDLRSGSASISIEHPDLPTTTVRCEDIGTISAEFDQNEEEAKGNVLFSLGTFTCTFFDELGSGNSFFDALDALLSTDEVTITLSFTDNSGNSSTSPFTFTKNDIEYRYLQRKVRIEANFRYDPDTQISSVLGANCSDVVLIGGYEEGNEPSAPLCGLTPSSGEIHALPTDVFIDYMISQMNTSNSNVNDTELWMNNSDPKYYVLSSDGSTTSNIATDRAVDVLYRMAVADGAIMGSFLGYNFFVPRTDSTSAVSISESDVESISITPTYEDYYIIRHSYLTELPPSLRSGVSEGFLIYDSYIGTDDGLNDNADKITNIYFQTRSITPATFDGTDYNNVSRDLFTVQYTVDGDVEGGSRVIEFTTDTSSTFSAGDWIFPSTAYDRTYEIESVDTTTVTLKEPLRDDIRDGDLMRAFVGMNSKEETFAPKTLESYARAFNAKGTRNISFTVLGTDTVKPYQAITFDTTFNDRVKNKTFRPYKIEYDLRADKINIEAYQI